MVSCFINQIVKLKNKIKKIKTYFKTVNEILENEKECPFPISVIPNNMGMNANVVCMKSCGLNRGNLNKNRKNEYTRNFI